MEGTAILRQTLIAGIVSLGMIMNTSSIAGSDGIHKNQIITVAQQSHVSKFVPRKTGSICTKVPNPPQDLALPSFC